MNFAFWKKNPEHLPKPNIRVDTLTDDDREIIGLIAGLIKKKGCNRRLLQGLYVNLTCNYYKFINNFWGNGYWTVYSDFFPTHKDESPVLSVELAEVSVSNFRFLKFYNLLINSEEAKILIQAYEHFYNNEKMITIADIKKKLKDI